MKAIDIRNATKPLSEYAKRADDEPLIVTRKGKPVAVLTSADGMDAESIALANNAKFAAIIARSRTRMEKEGGIPIEEVRRRLGIPRRKGLKRARSH